MESKYQNEEILKTLFPPVPNVNLLKYDETGLYSMTSRNVAKIISDIVKSYFQGMASEIIVTDCTAGLGGNSISFSENFKQVNSIEQDLERLNYFRENITLYENKVYENIKFYCGDFLEIIQNLNQDVIFIDPPWGGKNYKETPFLDIFINETPLYEVLNKLKGKSKLIVLKLPVNFNINEFYHKIEYKKLNFYKLPKMDLIIIKNKFV
jgi:16S rRNA G966 N2-methylase RsmD